MERQNKTNNSINWRNAIFVSILIHFVLIVLIIQFSPPLKRSNKSHIKQHDKPNTIISSYLLSAPKKINVELRPSDRPTTKTKDQQSHTVGQPALNSKPNIKTSKPVIKTVVKNKIFDTSPSKLKAEIKPQATAINPKHKVKAKKQNKNSDSALAINQNISSMSHVREYLDNKVTPPTNWEQHQKEQQNQTWHAQQKRQVIKKFKGEFVPDIPGMKDLGELGDGSQLIKHDGSCYAIKRDQFGDSLWLNTPCPLSSNPLRKAYRKSMSKYLKK